MFVAFALFYHIRMKLYMPPPFFRGVMDRNRLLGHFTYIIYAHSGRLSGMMQNLPHTLLA